jgi:hypothetical protein
VAASGFIWLVDWMIVCFDFILYLYIYLNMMRCQFIIGSKKVEYYVSES